MGRKTWYYEEQERQRKANEQSNTAALVDDEEVARTKAYVNSLTITGLREYVGYRRDLKAKGNLTPRGDTQLLLASAELARRTKAAKK